MFAVLVNRLVDKSLARCVDFVLLGSQVWRGFIKETGIQPEPFGNDCRIFHRGVELRESVAG